MGYSTGSECFLMFSDWFLMVAAAEVIEISICSDGSYNMCC